MPNLGEGDKSWQRVKDLVEALLDYKLNNRNDITHLDAKWEDETTTHLYVKFLLTLSLEVRSAGRWNTSLVNHRQR